jgi:AcrR family transcriptional regulator
MAHSESTGRTNQKLRTRKHLLDTAARMLKEGRQPTLDEVAEAALVSRATAYRYFPNSDALMLEASLHMHTPQLEDVFKDKASSDPVLRLQRVEQAFHDMVITNEPQIRMMLAQTLLRSTEVDTDSLPSRQNRRMPLIESALEPAKGEFTRANLDRLSKAAALIIGTEGMIVCKDVLHLEDSEARKLKQWAIKALVNAARRRTVNEE